uniref:Peptidase S1 domain-containing protein n=1 Tax=Panagrolaimus davidi TaxID=227884 RepID=A0A914PXK6_9BILA
MLKFPSKTTKAEESKNVCGISPALEKYNSNNTDKTIEGPVSKEGDWPWVVSLNSEGEGCTSTLIGEKWILTAAHCVTAGGQNTPNEKATAFAGSNEYLKGQNIPVEKIFVHSGWNWTTLSDDIALIKVSKVTFNDKIHPICLSSKLTNAPKNNSIAVGWGKTWDGHHSNFTRLLHEDIIPIQPWQHCTDLENHEPINPKKEICAGKGMHSVYHGDSGGPLMVIVNNRFYEIGITSWGLPAEDSQINENSDFEDIFTLIPAYCNWITETTNGEVKCE